MTLQCVDERHATPCPQPCVACEEECDPRQLDDDWIAVTQDHIDRGSPGDTRRCAVALALIDHFHASGANAGVTTASVWTSHDDFPTSFDLPGDASTWIEAFDGDKSRVKPIRFRLITR